MPPDEKGAQPAGNGRAPQKNIALGSNDGSHDTLEIPVSQLRHRSVRPGELSALRAVWWNQARTGNRLPTEIGVIVIPGGAI